MGGEWRISRAPIGAYASPIGGLTRGSTRIAASDHLLSQQHRQGATMSTNYRNHLIAAGTLWRLLAAPERLSNSTPGKETCRWQARWRLA
jgi:hypothetical protein